MKPDDTHGGYVIFGLEIREYLGEPDPVKGYSGWVHPSEAKVFPTIYELVTYVNQLALDEGYSAPLGEITIRKLIRPIAWDVEEL